MQRRIIPTVLIGVGRVGILAMLRSRSKARAKAASILWPPPIRFFGLDCDPGVLRSIDGIDPAATDIQDLVLQCKFQPPGNYYKRWEDLKNLSSWLDSQYVFQIPSTGGTAGHRPLGRLAVFENARRFATRLKIEVESLKQDAATFARFTGDEAAEVDFSQLRVLLVAGMGGGMGSGALVDLGYIAQKTLKDLGHAAPAVEALLIAGVERDPRNRELVNVDHFALAQELLQFTQEDSELKVNYGDGPQHFLGPAVTRCTLFDAMVESLPEPRLEAVCDAIGELVWHGSTSLVGQELHSATLTWPMFRGFGWFELFFPARTLERRLSLKACEAVLDRWLATLNTRDADDVAVKAEAALATVGFDSKTIADLVFQAANGKLDDLIFSTVSNRIHLLQEKLADPKSDPKESLRSALADIRDWLGSEATETKDDSGSLKLLWAIRDGAKDVANKVLGPLTINVDRIMETPGPRLDRLRHALRGYSDYFVKIVDQQTENSKRELEQCGRLYKSVCDKLDSKLMAAVSSSVNLANTVQQYANAKIVHRLSENIANVYVTLRGKLSDRLKDLISARQRVDQLRDQIRKELSAVAEYGAGFSTQPIFPGGLLSLDEAVAEAYGKLFPAKLLELEERIQKDAVVPAGGMAQVVNGDTSLETGFGAKMVAAATAWLREQLGPCDVARAFLDRHRAEPANAANEIAAFVGWAAPTCPVRPGKPGADNTPGVELLVLTCPESEAGSQCRAGIEATLSTVELRVLSNDFEIILCRTAAHESLARLLPNWVMDCARPYKAACQGRQSPELFRDLSDR